MKAKTLVLLLVSHMLVGVLGFGLGIYALPILIAPPSPSDTQINALAREAQYQTTFVRDLKGSDALHWGEGQVSLSSSHISLMGSLSPGPDYQLYLSPSFVETEAQFEQVKASSLNVGSVKTFENYKVELAPSVNIDAFNTVVVWCETFGEFISAGKYK